MSAHTPGPWGVSDNHGQKWIETADGNDDSICHVHRRRENVSSIRDDEFHANARLIAAAPDLLAALVPVVKDAEQAEFEVWLENERPSGDIPSVHQKWEASSEYRSFCEHWQSQITAIAKARGTP